MDAPIPGDVLVRTGPDVRPSSRDDWLRTGSLAFVVHVEVFTNPSAFRMRYLDVVGRISYFTDEYGTSVEFNDFWEHVP